MLFADEMYYPVSGLFFFLCLLGAIRFFRSAEKLTSEQPEVKEAVMGVAVRFLGQLFQRKERS